ncbi:hypothetical protein PR048_022724 [Dryococelus australis]|uniref:Dipeptidase n=1 Tax=Dryococelus australis TaxID=614101 RepID=A0ABQ9GS32_9NEOP|nr:hypothetical protein PR048_022724 [Dryococelus australis]
MTQSGPFCFANDPSKVVIGISYSSPNVSVGSFSISQYLPQTDFEWHNYVGSIACHAIQVFELLEWCTDTSRKNNCALCVETRAPSTCLLLLIARLGDMHRLSMLSSREIKFTGFDPFTTLRKQLITDLCYSLCECRHLDTIAAPSMPDDTVDRRVFSGISRLPRPLIPELLHTHLDHVYRPSRPRCQDSPKYLHFAHNKHIRVNQLEFILALHNVTRCVLVRSTPQGLENVSRYPDLLAHLMEDEAWSEEDLKKLAGLNILRVFKDVEEVPAHWWRGRVRNRTYLLPCLQSTSGIDLGVTTRFGPGMQGTAR